jgi:hypothetical protein
VKIECFHAHFAETGANFNPADILAAGSAASALVAVFKRHADASLWQRLHPDQTARRHALPVGEMTANRITGSMEK